jgi:hypothetical protein
MWLGEVLVRWFGIRAIGIQLGHNPMKYYVYWGDMGYLPMAARKRWRVDYDLLWSGEITQSEFNRRGLNDWRDAG